MDIVRVEGQLTEADPESAVLALVKGIHHLLQGDFKGATTALTQG